MEFLIAQVFFINAKLMIEKHDKSLLKASTAVSLCLLIVIVFALILPTPTENFSICASSDKQTGWAYPIDVLSVTWGKAWLIQRW